ncbi:MAG TPA: hypothetical protein ENN29_09905 [Candidatus Hydrogenedentes bacterium]|nr:hypothetical protein [Candidatus Hydrogenedentota bacterium]
MSFNLLMKLSLPKGRPARVCGRSACANSESSRNRFSISRQSVPCCQNTNDMHMITHQAIPRNGKPIPPDTMMSHTGNLYTGNSWHDKHHSTDLRRSATVYRGLITHIGTCRYAKPNTAKGNTL